MKNNFTDEEKVEIAKKEYQKNLKINDPLYLSDDTKIGYVSDEFDNPITGLQMYVVTPQRANIANTNPASIKSAIVLFRGSTSPSIDFRNPSKMIDSIADWAFNDIPLAKSIGYSHLGTINWGPKATSQLIDASSTFNYILTKYPNAKINTYAHSLGVMSESYSLVNVPKKDLDRIKDAYFFEGPNIFKLLSPKQIKNVNKLKSKIHVYVDKNDIVPIGYEKHAKTIGKVIYIKSKYLGFSNAGQ